MKEEHLQGFRTGLTRSLKKYADASGMLDKLKFDISGMMIFVRTYGYHIRKGC
jgi:DNA gyrase/topoisomerase IV subunit B